MHVDSGVLIKLYVLESNSGDAVFRRSMELATACTAETLARSLDVLHVAMAGAPTVPFVTADKRQAEVAKRAGFEVRLVE